MRQEYANRYLTDKVMTASPAELVGMLYDAGVVAMQAGKAAIEAGNIADIQRHLVRAHDIVFELSCSLRLDAGEIAHNLNSLYGYLLQRLATAHAQKDAKVLAECLGIFTELRDAWGEACLGRSPVAVG
jgi:flagellar secretion chaperone FliS